MVGNLGVANRPFAFAAFGDRLEQSLDRRQLFRREGLEQIFGLPIDGTSQSASLRKVCRIKLGITNRSEWRGGVHARSVLISLETLLEHPMEQVLQDGQIIRLFLTLVENLLNQAGLNASACGSERFFNGFL